MCGIVAYVGKIPASAPMLIALKHLEYRGYDSAGIATLEAGRLTRRRAAGNLENLEKKLNRQPLAGHIGIGHTRWATHGRPDERNAHPHAINGVAVVHNGIIENHHELRKALKAAGAIFKTGTDTEVIAHLVSQQILLGLSPVQAVRASLPKLEGAFALAFLFQGHDNLIIGARKGSPLAVGYGADEMYLGSDAIALAPLTGRINYLREGEIAVMTRASIEFSDWTGECVQRTPIEIPRSDALQGKGEHRHYMIKEIHQQPEVVRRTLAQYIDASRGKIRTPVGETFGFQDVNRLSIIACGTSYYAGLVAKYWFEQYAGLPVDIDIASEYRYRSGQWDPGNIALLISQSGETADTLASLELAKMRGQRIVSIVNVANSTIARASDVVLSTLAGVEVGVASTKAFTCQLATLACLAVAAGLDRSVLTAESASVLVRSLATVPDDMEEVLKLESDVRSIALELKKYSSVLYMGRGTAYPLALEGALKLKEVSYIHAEGYAAGELKHGPIALIDKNMPVVVIAPPDANFAKTMSNTQEILARGGRVILLTDKEGLRHAPADTWKNIVLPDAACFIAPLLYVLPLQLLGYHAALALGANVDQPRNLAKAVTVE